MSGAAIARRLGISKSTVSYHQRRLGEPIDSRCNRRYDWAAVQCFYEEGHTITQCQERFGFARKTFMDAVCPNCHAQTPNFSGRNRRLRRATRGLLDEAA